MSNTSISIKSLKQIVPAPVKRAANELRLHRKLRNAIDQIAAMPPGQLPTRQMLFDLQSGWANEGFAARIDFLTEVARQATTTAGPILECGSGITTILMGLLAGRRRVKTYSLEHIAEWRTRLLGTLERFDVPGVEIVLAPLRDFGEFAWYDAPLRELPDRFEVVVCDGPPGDTHGGRYGIMPVLGARLKAGAVILLDDTERAGEAEVLQRWAFERKFTVSAHEGGNGSYAVISLVEDVQLDRDAAEINDSEMSTEGLPPSVSVIIPAYNVTPYIIETLASVFAQSFKDFEVIVVNDGSPDTEEFERVIAPYRDRIRYFKQENRGASVARNTGLHAARGEFVAFLDADDLWLSNYLEEQMKFIRERGCDLVCADASYFGDASLTEQTYMQSLMETAPSTGDVTFMQLLNAERHLITSGIVARRQPIMDVGQFDVTLRNSQDFDLWLRLVRHGVRLSYHKDVLLKYRCRQDGLTGDSGNSLRRELRILDRIEQTYDLSPTERAKAIPVIRGRRALTEFELAKLHLTRGQFNEARSAFARSNQYRPSLKKSAALWLTRLAPRVVQAIYLRRAAKS